MSVPARLPPLPEFAAVAPAPSSNFQSASRSVAPARFTVAELSGCDKSYCELGSAARVRTTVPPLPMALSIGVTVIAALDCPAGIVTEPGSRT